MDLFTLFSILVGVIFFFGLVVVLVADLRNYAKYRDRQSLGWHTKNFLREIFW